MPLLLAMTYIVSKTKMGKAMRAVAQDQDGARLMGINVNGTISFTFGLGGALAGAAGVLYFLCQTQTYYDTGTQLGLIAFTAAVLGGIGNLTGAVVGGLAIGIIQALNEGGAYGLGSNWSQSVVFLILIVLMVFKPEGIFGRPDDREGVTRCRQPLTPAAPAPVIGSTTTSGRSATWLVILFLFLLYHAILPNLVKPVSAPVIAWLPVATINECLMWAIMALGLNVVVGYAGLLDLGYVAFWALGGYTAGWLMAYPVQLDLELPPVLPGPGQRPGHAHQLLARVHHRRRPLRDPRHHHRRADAAAPRRLPGPGDARLRRGHHPVLPQLQRHRRLQHRQR